MVENYIRVYPDIIPQALCQLARDTFDNDTGNQEPSGYLDADGSMPKVDAMCIKISSTTGWEEIDNQFFGHVKTVWDKYQEEFDVLSRIPDSIEDHAYEIHRYTKGEGYQTEHYDAGQVGYSKRIVTVIMYLNDVVKGGRTLFSGWGVKIIPKAGSILVFPSAFTHMHQGELPESGDKYILRTWMQFK